MEAAENFLVDNTSMRCPIYLDVHLEIVACLFLFLYDRKHGIGSKATMELVKGIKYICLGDGVSRSWEEFDPEATE